MHDGLSLTPRQRLALWVIHVTSGSLSLLSSFTIICMILRSKRKLTVPYRRIVFGLSVYDMIFSTACIIAWPSLPSSEKIWGTIGTQQTCEIQAFIFTVGASGAPLYNLSLCVFFICQIVFSMKASVFEKKVEPFLHVIITALSYTSATYLLVNNYFNAGSDYIVCWIAPYPIHCDSNDKIKCLRGENFSQMRWIFMGVPLLFVFGMVILIMSTISWKVIQQEMRTHNYRLNPYQSVEKKISRGHSAEITPLKIERNRQSLKMIRRSKKSRAALTQALWYVFAHLITWMLPCFETLMIRNGKHIPFFVRILTRLLNPAQGIINIFVYTRGSIIVLRARNPAYSWRKAFITVIKSGGDNDGNIARERIRRRSSL